METTVLITAAIRPPRDVPYLQMADAANRLIATKSALFFFVSQKVRNIVIADATGSRILTHEEIKQISGMGINIEQISYHQDQSIVREKGKGFAEGHLIEFSLRKSELLSRSPSFFKCTGKVLCRNLHQLDAELKDDNLSSLFWLGSWSGLDMRYPDLRFFFTNREFILDHLLAGYLAGDDSVGRVVETSCGEILHGTLSRGVFTRPRLSGFSGGFDKQYDEQNLGDLEDAFPCLLQTR